MMPVWKRAIHQIGWVLIWSLCWGTGASAQKPAKVPTVRSRDKVGRRANPTRRRPSKRPVRRTKPERVETVVVTSARGARKLKDVVVTTEVISREQIRRSSATQLSDLLATHTGIQLSRDPGVGIGVLMQGLESKHVLILVDGQRLAGRNRGVMDLGRFPLERIERIEIVKGASSALYGSEALGGVINIITRKSKKGLHGEVEGRGGMAGSPMWDLTGFLSARGRKWRGSFSLGFHDYQRFDLDPNTPATSGSSNRQFLVEGKGGFRFSRNTDLALRAQYLYRYRAGLDSNSVGGVFDRISQTQVTEASFILRTKLGTFTKIRWSGNFNYFRDEFLYSQQGVNRVNPPQNTIDMLGQTVLQLDQAFGMYHLLTVGFEGLAENLETSRLKDEVANRLRGAVYAQHEWMILEEPALTLVPGLRAEVDSQFGFAITPKVALRFDVIRGLIFRGSYGWGFRAPSFKELYLTFENTAVGYVVSGFEGLRPERSQSIQAGVEWRRVRGLSVTLNFFRNDVDDLIDYKITREAGQQGFSISYANIAEALAQGVELQVQWAPQRWFQLSLGYTLTDTEDKTKTRERGEKVPLPNRALHQANLQMMLRDPWLGLRFFTRGTFIGSRLFFGGATDGPAVTEDPIPADAYVLLHARISRSFWKEKFQVFVALQNILNAGNHVTLPIRPRSFFAGVRGRF